MKDNLFLKQKQAALERERYSSFVVDLREIAKQNKEQAVSNKNNKKPKSRVFSRNFLTIKKPTKPTLNFLQNTEEEIISRVKNIFNFKKAKEKNFWSWNNFWSKFSFVGNKKKNWRDKVRAKQRILSRRFRLNRREELARAQSRVIWYRSFLTFVLVLVFLILPLKLLSYFQVFDLAKLEDQVMTKSKAAFNNLLVAFDSASTLDFKEADRAFSKTSQAVIVFIFINY
jgi:hypothetical protein